ncbi:Fc receptor-like protein 5 [Mixophyes fleayi]|uniref:Fc receptor-like protein 5 n=1 Tax=Mixophyes fleayi TaxID=3061075 RepID=UPI003F4E000D
MPVPRMEEGIPEGYVLGGAAQVPRIDPPQVLLRVKAFSSIALSELDKRLGCYPNRPDSEFLRVGVKHGKIHSDLIFCFIPVREIFICILQPVTMYTETFIFFLCLGILQTPPRVYEGDNLIIRCHHRPGYSSGHTIFYKDNGVIRDWGPDPVLHIGNVVVRTAGKYKCNKEIRGSSWQGQFEDAVSIDVQELFSLPQIKVTPHPVIAGDNMTLTCDTSLSPLRQMTELQFAFYRDGRNVQEFSSSDKYGVLSAQLEDSGNYYCDIKTSNNAVNKTSKVLTIEIKELFATPEIKVKPFPATEGDHMTLTCDTSLSPLRQMTELQFAFYRDGRNVQEFSSSDKYGVLSAQLEDSGKYTCEIKTLANSLKKMSRELHVQIQDDVPGLHRPEPPHGGGEFQRKRREKVSELF